MNARPTFLGPRPCARAHLPPAAERVQALGARDCRWPLGDPLDEGFRFCGEPRRGRGSYCGAHRALSREALQ